MIYYKIFWLTQNSILHNERSEKNMEGYLSTMYKITALFVREKG